MAYTLFLHTEERCIDRRRDGGTQQRGFTVHGNTSEPTALVNFWERIRKSTAQNLVPIFASCFKHSYKTGYWAASLSFSAFSQRGNEEEWQFQRSVLPIIKACSFLSFPIFLLQLGFVYKSQSPARSFHISSNYSLANDVSAFNSVLTFKDNTFLH